MDLHLVGVVGHPEKVVERDLVIPNPDQVAVARVVPDQGMEATASGSAAIRCTLMACSPMRVGPRPAAETGGYRSTSAQPAPPVRRAEIPASAMKGSRTVPAAPAR